MILGNVNKAGAHHSVVDASSLRSELEAKCNTAAPSNVDKVRGSKARAQCSAVNARILKELQVTIKAQKPRSVISSRVARTARNKALKELV